MAFRASAILNLRFDGLAEEWLWLPKNRQSAPQTDNSGRGCVETLRGNVHRSRHALNADTIREMHAAFRQGGREAIDKVMERNPRHF